MDRGDIQAVNANNGSSGNNGNGNNSGYGWHAMAEREALDALKTSEKGLTMQEASARLRHYGRNEIRQVEKLSPILIFLLQFKSVFILILLFAAAFSLYIKHYVDFSVIAFIVVLNSSIGFFQQYKAEKVIAKLKALLVPRVKVIRNSRFLEISSSQLVPGDVIILSSGDKIMADCRVIKEDDLQVNEAILTGESMPQEKNAFKIKQEIELSSRTNMLYMGTTVVNGNCQAVVVATGMSTEFGRIAKLVQKVEIHRTLLEEKLDSFSKKIAFLIVFLSILTAVIGFLRGEDLFVMVLTGISLAVSVIPEGLPAVIALTLAFAIRRMQKNNALIRKLPAAETLGRTTVICTDKTGTITLEEMSVTELYNDSQSFSIKDHSVFLKGRKINPARYPALMKLFRVGIMCNNAKIEKNDIFGDPTEKALVIAASKAGLIKKEETEKEARIKEYTFSSRRKMMSIIRQSSNGQLISYVKGAPDVILSNCSKEMIGGRIVSLTLKRKNELLRVDEEMANKALRVLGFAFKELSGKFSQQDAETGMVFAGFQGMIDPPRKEVKNAITECHHAGIKVKMITGDSLLTALAVSKMVGLEPDGITGAELEKLPETEFNDIVRTKTVFARINPELKLKIIHSLKKQGEVVAASGDGVNDVLALKESHIGVAMGIRGTDVTRDVADIILLDDNFSSIVKAVREGRRVYDNLKKSIKFHLAANVAEMFIVLLAMVLAMPLPMLPLAILWMNLITDSLPSLALTVEKSDKDIMKRKPISPKESILDNISGFIAIAGTICLAVTFGVFLLYYKTDLALARTMVLTTATFFEMFLVFSCRSDRNLFEIGLFSNKFVLYSVIGAVALQLIALYTPLAMVFGFVALPPAKLLLVVLLSSAGFVFFETSKFIKSRISSKINGIH